MSVVTIRRATARHRCTAVATSCSVGSSGQQSTKLFASGADQALGVDA